MSTAMAAIAHPDILEIANRHQCTPAQLVFRFALDAGLMPLTGTTSEDHMQADLAVFDLSFSPDEIAVIEKIATS